VIANASPWRDFKLSRLDRMLTTPLYTPATMRDPAYQLRYGWTGWVATRPAQPVDFAMLFGLLNPIWETDSIRRLEHRVVDGTWQMTFSVKPHVSPVFLATRVKGRLQDVLRKQGNQLQFSRKLAVRSIGENTRANVEAYIARQVDKEAFADLRFRDTMREFTVKMDGVDLAEPTTTDSGRYWFNLHIVLVVDQRHRVVDPRQLAIVCDMSLRIAPKKGWAISTLSVMPDHLHIALRGSIAQSPEEMVLALMNNLAYALGQRQHWQPSYYAGTFSEYDMGAVRHRASTYVVSPPNSFTGQASWPGSIRFAPSPVCPAGAQV
jgi:REP element-mobilizing transposase RayT